MDCTYFRELGSAIIDNEATDAEIKEFNEHISTCPDCSKWFEAIKILKSETEDMTEAVPSELKSRVMASVANANKKPSLFSRFKFTAVAAAVAIIIFAVNGFVSTSPEEILPQAVSEQPMAGSRMAPPPEKVAAGVATETPDVPYDRAFSYIVYLTEGNLPDFLLDADFESIGDYKYYITEEKFESLSEFSYELIAYNPKLDLEGLVIIKE